MVPNQCAYVYITVIDPEWKEGTEKFSTGASLKAAEADEGISSYHCGCLYTNFHLGLSKVFNPLPCK